MSRSSTLPLLATPREGNKLEESDEEMFTVPEMDENKEEMKEIGSQGSLQSCNNNGGEQAAGPVKRRRGRNPIDKEYRRLKRSQQVGVDCDETFSPVVKPTTIRIVLSLAVSKKWQIHQLDVKNAFLHGHLAETVYMHQPPGFRDKDRPNHVCLLKKSLYGLKQAPRAWYHRFASFVSTVGFRQSRSDNSLFIYRNGSEIAYLLLYVDDIILATSSEQLRLTLMGHLHSEFAMTDLGPLNFFLGVAAVRNTHGLFLHQHRYVEDIINRANMGNCRPAHTPVDTNSKLSATDGAPVSDPSLFRSLAGALQYLTFTRPDISYAIQQVCLHMHDPREAHFAALKRIVRYIKGTTHFGLHITESSTTTLVTYTDADWAGCPDTRRSTSGLLRNRVSAQQAREKKKVYVNDLESRAKELQENSFKLEEKISILTNENSMLRKVLMNTRPKVDDDEETKHV